MSKSKPNIVIFASDAKHTSYLNSIILEAWDRANVYYMICTETQLKYPTIQPELFHINHNVNNPQPVKSYTLNQTLPFKPDWLIISRERWDPESSIIKEFKNEFSSKIALVEPNSALIGSINVILEFKSKNRFVNDIDVFFDHSDFTKKQRESMGLKGNIVVVGNPKFDVNLDVDEKNLSDLKQYYNIDPNKKQALFFTLQNKYRYKLFEEFKKFKLQHPEYQYFVKPYPGEPFDPLFKKEYFPKFFIEGVTPILEESHIWGMYNICDIHIGSFSSVMYTSFYLNKEVYEFSKEIGARENLWDNKDIIDSKGGHEENLNMWLRVFNTNVEDFKKLTAKENILPMLKNNEEIWDKLDNLLYYKQDILKMYDKFNDKQASKRILNYIEKNHE